MFVVSIWVFHWVENMSKKDFKRAYYVVESTWSDVSQGWQVKVDGGVVGGSIPRSLNLLVLPTVKYISRHP